MDKFWRAALGVAGLAAIAFFVFYGLYKRFLSLPIFPTLRQDQAFVLMLVFLSLTFLALVVGVIAWAKSRHKTGDGQDAPLYRLETLWNGVNYIDCENLIGPDVNRAGNALDMTATYWRNQFVDKRIISEKYGKQYCEIFEQIDRCGKQVPGYDNPLKRCRDFLPPMVRSTYVEIKNAIRT